MHGVVPWLAVAPFSFSMLHPSPPASIMQIRRAKQNAFCTLENHIYASMHAWSRIHGSAHQRHSQQDESQRERSRGKRKEERGKVIVQSVIVSWKLIHEWIALCRVHSQLPIVPRARGNRSSSAWETGQLVPINSHCVPRTK